MNPPRERFITVRIVYKSNLWRLRNGGELLILHFMYPCGTVVNKCIWNEKAILFNKVIKYNEVYDIYMYDNTNNMYIIDIHNIKSLFLYANGTSDVPPIIYNCLPIAEILKMGIYNVVDCIAVCRIVGCLQKTTTKRGITYLTRKLYLVDDSKAVIALILWDEDARNFNHKAPFVIDVRKAIIRVYENENELNVSTNTLPEINPSCLEQWYNHNMSIDFEWRDSFLCSNKPFSPAVGYFKMEGVIHYIDFQNLFYEACNFCRKKLIKRSTNGQYFCEECIITTSNFQYQLMLKMSIGEPSLDVICFNEVVENFIGQSAEDVAQALEKNLTSAEEIFKTIYYKKFIFYVQMKETEYEGEMKLNHVVLSAIPI